MGTNDQSSRLIAPSGLVIGAVLGMAGTFVPSASLRGLFWGLDGIALIVATALLTIHHFRRGNDPVAAGFLVFVVGETLILSGAAMDLAASGPLFAAGTGLWAASLALVSAPTVMPSWVRVVAAFAALLFAIVALQIFMGRALTPLSQPLPFFAYPFLAVTLFARAWVHYRMPPNQDEPTALRAARYPVRQASMTPLTPAVAQKIEALFPPESREAARGMITGRCGADLPLSTHMGPDPSGFDRIRFAEDTPHYQITRGILEASERCWRLLRNETDEE